MNNQTQAKAVLKKKTQAKAISLTLVTEIFFLVTEYTSN